MVLSTASLRGDTAALVSQREEIDQQLSAGEAERILERRKALADELATCKITGDGGLPELAANVKASEESLKSAQAALRRAESDRATLVRTAGARADLIRAELLASAPREIAVAEAELQAAITDALAVQKATWSERGSARIRHSNHDAVAAYVLAARTALANIRGLRVTALTGKPLARAIKGILKNVPEASFPLIEIEVKSEPTRNSQHHRL